jgi:hypothetical protein
MGVKVKVTARPPDGAPNTKPSIMTASISIKRMVFPLLLECREPGPVERDTLQVESHKDAVKNL